MPEKFTLTAKNRSEVGKSASRRLRCQEDAVPAIIYGGQQHTETIYLQHKNIVKALEQEAFFSSILNVAINEKAEKVVLKAVQRHPSKARILHLDFMRISASEKLTMQVPLHLIGEDIAVGIKEGGTITKHLTELEVRCLPNDLPEYIEVDISQLKLDSVLHVSHVKLPEGVELATAIEGVTHDQSIVSISTPRVALEEDSESTTNAGEVPSAQKDDEAKRKTDN